MRSFRSQACFIARRTQVSPSRATRHFNLLVDEKTETPKDRLDSRLDKLLFSEQAIDLADPSRLLHRPQLPRSLPVPVYDWNRDDGHADTLLDKYRESSKQRAYAYRLIELDSAR